MNLKEFDFDIDMSAVIRGWINDTGKNQKDIAEMMGLSQQNLSHHLKRRTPTMDFVLLACKALRKYPWEIWFPKHELEKVLEKQMSIPYEYLEPSVIVYNMPPEIRNEVLRLISDTLESVVSILSAHNGNHL